MNAELKAIADFYGVTCPEALPAEHPHAGSAIVAAEFNKKIESTLQRWRPRPSPARDVYKIDEDGCEVFVRTLSDEEYEGALKNHAAEVAEHKRTGGMFRVQGLTLISATFHTAAGDYISGEWDEAKKCWRWDALGWDLPDNRGSTVIYRT